MSRKKLMVLQAGQSQARIIETARRMGFYVIAADRDPKAPGFMAADEAMAVDVIDGEGILREARRHGIDGILPGGDVSLPSAAYVAKEMGLVGLTPAQAAVATDKERYYRAFKDNGVPIPRMSIISSEDGLERALEHAGYPAIVKPAASFGGSRGVKRVSRPEEAGDAFAFAMDASRNGRVIVEEFLDGEEHTVESVVHRGKNHVLAVSDKWRLKDTFCVGTSLNYPSRLPDSMLGRIDDIARRAADAIGLKDWITHIEVITSGDDVRLIDFGARGGGAGYIPSVIVTNVTGVNMMEAFIRILAGESPGALTPACRNGVVYRFLTPRPGKVVGIKGMDEAKAMEGFVDMGLYVGVGDSIAPISTQLDRSGFFVVRGRDFDDAMSKAGLFERTLQIVTE